MEEVQQQVADQARQSAQTTVEALRERIAAENRVARHAGEGAVHTAMNR